MAALGALAAAAAGVLVAVHLVRSVPGPTDTSGAVVPAATTAASTVTGGRIATPDDAGFPSPPEGALVLARQAKAYALGLALAPDDSRTLVRVSVVGGDGPVSGLGVSFDDASLASCGAGCYQATIATVPHGAVTVTLGKARYGFDVPSGTTADGSEIVTRAAKVWRALHTLVWHESLSGGTGTTLHVRYESVAPDELAYTISNGGAARIIGGYRWDRATPNGKWTRSPQSPPVSQPQPYWVEAADARIVGITAVAGRPAWQVSFFDPLTPGWFLATVDRATYRTVDLRMIATAHFMHDTYGPFDSPLTLDPP